MLRRLEALIAAALIASRWLMAPLYLGLIAALVVIGVEFFKELVTAGVGTLGTGTSSRDHPEWTEFTGKVDFAGLKLKVVVSLVAIAAVDLLEDYIDVDAMNKTDLLWRIAILMTFVVTGVLLAWMDRLAAEPHD
jgi:uncharacterized membrane protein YqhA